MINPRQQQHELNQLRFKKSPEERELVKKLKSEYKKRIKNEQKG